MSRNSISVQSMNSSLSQTSLQSSSNTSHNSRAFDFDGLEESLVDNELNESIESLNDLNYESLHENHSQNQTTTDDRRRRLDDTDDNHNDDNNQHLSRDIREQQQREQSFHRIRDALIRDSHNRSDDDLDLIQNFLSLIIRQKTTQQTTPQTTTHRTTHSLLNKDFQTRRLLAKHMVLAEIESRDTRVLTHGERLDAYCVVACGSLRHVVTGCHELSHTTADDRDDSCVDCVDGECPQTRHLLASPAIVVTSDGIEAKEKTRYLCVGDEFGSSLDDRVVFGEIYTNEDFVWVLCVPHVVFDEICGEKSFKTVFDEKNEKIIEIRNQLTNELIRATKQRLLDLLFSSHQTTARATTPVVTQQDDTQQHNYNQNSHQLNDTFDDTNETEFISDFLLTFRLFWKSRDFRENNRNSEIISELMEKIIENMKNEKNVEKNVKIVLFWISNHFQDFSRDLFDSFESSLKSKIHKKLFYFTLSTKSRERHVTLTRSDRTSQLPFTLIGGYECSTRLFISDVTDECETDISRGDRILSINGVDCHVMEVSRALELCRSCTHLSLLLKFDPNLFHLLIDGQISRNSESKRHLTTDSLKSATLLTTNASFMSLKPKDIQQLSSTGLQVSSNNNQNNNQNNNWKQKMRQIVQNVAINSNKLINNSNHNNQNCLNNNNSVVVLNSSSGVTPTTGLATLTSTTTDLHSGGALNATPEIMKIYYESDFRYLPIHVTTTARECIQLALIEFQLNGNYSSRDFALYEYKLIDKTTSTSAVKRLSDNYQNLVKNLSLNARIYLKCISGVSQTTLNDTDITREITRESHVNSLLTLDGEAIARELTERDFELFCRIESQQFIYDLTTDSSVSDDTTTLNDDNRKELKEFELKTNSEMFWTINQILFESNSSQKRVKIVKQLIRIALQLKELNNYNSLFAIMSGLSHQSIQRLKQCLWEKIPQKSLQKLKKLYKLMDPSKNFLEFRSQLKHSFSPIIPFFPLVKKDLSFIYLANQTFIQTNNDSNNENESQSDNNKNSNSVLINWEKMRLLAQKIKEVQLMTIVTSQQQQQQCSRSRRPTSSSATLASSISAANMSSKLKSFSDSSKETNYKKIWEKQRMTKRVQHFLDKSFLEIILNENILFEKSFECESQPQTQQQQVSSSASSSARMSSSSSQSALSSSLSLSNTNNNNKSQTSITTTNHVMPSPTPSSHSSSPSLSSSTTNSSDIQSTTSSGQQSSGMRLRFGVKDDTGLRKLLALSDNCVSVVHHNHQNHSNSSQAINLHHHSNHSNHSNNNSQQQSHCSSSLLFAHQTAPQNSHLMLSSHYLSSHPSSLSGVSSTRLSVPSFGTTCSSSSGVVGHKSLPQESSSVTSLRRLEQLQQLSRFREQFIPSFGGDGTNASLVTAQHLASGRPTQPSSHRLIGRPLLPSYDQTIQRMKKKLNKNEENVV